MDTKKFYINIIESFQKVITSLVCIKAKSSDNNITKKTEEFLNDLIFQYENYQQTRNSNTIFFKYSEKEIVDFCNECYEKSEILIFAEDLEFGFEKLIKLILESREQ